MDLSLIDSLTLAFWSPGPAEMMVLAVVALLLYGGKLPEVARSWGKSFAEFRRGLSGFQNELNEVIYSEPERIAYHHENYRDDACNDQGYDHAEDYPEEPAVDPGETTEPREAGEQTVTESSADTVVMDDAKEVIPAETDSQRAEKPAN